MPDQVSTPLLLDRTSRLRAAFCADPVDESAVKDAVCAFVDEAKRLGWPAERVIIEIKRIAEVETGPLFLARGHPAEERKARDVVQRAITWCIQHYFWTSSS